VLARTEWLGARTGWDLRNLVFLDETGVATNMTRRYGRAEKGKRCLASAPHGHWHTNTFVAALRHDCVTAPIMLNGPMNGEAFLTCVKESLVPTLKPGDIVIADNLSSHKVAGVREAVSEAGATMLFLPPYSPDFNPIEMFFSKIKALLRKTEERSIKALTCRIGNILDEVRSDECKNFFTASGYVST
jgi:transposase